MEKETRLNNDTHVKRRLQKLCNNDSIRFNRFFEMIQYGIIYYFIGTVLAVLIESCFFRFSENKGFIINYFEFLLLVIITLLISFYTQKLIKCIPLLLKSRKFKPYLTKEYRTGGVLLVISMLYFQRGFVSRITYLRDNIPSL